MGQRKQAMFQKRRAASLQRLDLLLNFICAWSTPRVCGASVTHQLRCGGRIAPA